MEFLIVLGAILLLWLWYFVAKQFYLIAAEKGYDNKKYLWFTYFLTPLGIAMIIALPDRGILNPEKANVSLKDELPEL